MRMADRLRELWSRTETHPLLRSVAIILIAWCMLAVAEFVIFPLIDISIGLLFLAWIVGGLIYTVGFVLAFVGELSFLYNVADVLGFSRPMRWLFVMVISGLLIIVYFLLLQVQFYWTNFLLVEGYRQVFAVGFGGSIAGCVMFVMCMLALDERSSWSERKQKLNRLKVLCWLGPLVGGLLYLWDKRHNLRDTWPERKQKLNRLKVLCWLGPLVGGLLHLWDRRH